MSGDCRNDCLDPIRLPKRPSNRPGLSRIGYRIGAYSDFREALLRQLDRSPLLSELTYRASDDPGIALLECAAIACDILTFYQDLYANEAYLRTAAWPESIAGLVRLLGYRMSPGVGGQATFAFEVRPGSPVTIPAGFPVKADLENFAGVDFETSSQIVAVPELSRFAMYRAYFTPDITTGSKVFALDTVDLENAQVKIQAGDRLMLVNPDGSTDPARQIVKVKSVARQFEQTEITIEGSWQGGFVSPTVHAFRLGRSFRHFGYNAPPTETVVTGGVADQVKVSFLRSLTNSSIRLSVTETVARVTSKVIRGETIDDQPALPSSQYFALDKQVDDLSAGATLLVSFVARVPAEPVVRRAEGLTELVSDTTSQQPAFFEPSILRFSSAALTKGSLTGGATIVKVDRDLGNAFSGGTVDIRSVEMQEVIGPRLTLQSARTSSGSADVSRLYFFGTGAAYQALGGRQIQLVQENPLPGAEPIVETATAGVAASAVGQLDWSTLRPVTLSPSLQALTAGQFPLPIPDVKPIVSVYANLAQATQGKTEKPAVLGNGDARQVFQTFQLPKRPLTYLISNSATPPEVPQLTVTVDGVNWSVVPSLFNAQPEDRVYIVREDAKGNSWVQFGDGVTGSRLASGAKNVSAVYRSGSGAYGPLKEGTKAQAGARLTRLGTIQLPDGASGGAGSEDPDKAREAAPGKVQSLGRMVSLRDFETEALAIPGISKVSASWGLEDNIPVLLLTVLMETGREAEVAAVQTVMNSYNICRGPQRFPVIVQVGELAPVFVNVAFALGPAFQKATVTAAIAEALGVDRGAEGLFAPSRRAFGAREYATRIEGIVQNVPGVQWAEVQTAGVLGSTPDPATRIIACGAHQILGLAAVDLQLNQTTVTPGVCS